MTLTTDQLEELAKRQTQRLESLSGTAQDQVSKLWADVGSMDDADRFIEQASSRMEVIRKQSADNTVTYLADYERGVTDEPVPTDLVDTRDVARSLRGSSIEQVYTRPFASVATALEEGKPLQTALRLGLNRALTLADTDVALAQNVTAQEHMSRRNRVVGYRRVPDAAACPLCLMASTQRYNRAELQPIHSRCHCSIAPIIGTSDPGQVIDKKLLDDLKRKKLTKSEPNSDLGQVLSPASDEARAILERIESHPAFINMSSQEAHLRFIQQKLAERDARRVKRKVS